MRPPLCAFLVGTVASGLGASLLLPAHADPIPFPPGGVYTFGFESDPFSNGWTLDIETEDALGNVIFLTAWMWDFIPASGASLINPGEFGEGVVRNSNGGFDDTAFGGANFPLDPIVPAENHADLGFSGDSWLRNVGVGEAVDLGNGFVPRADGVARLEFTGLPEHTGLDITFKLAVGGSIDGGGNALDGTFGVSVDGESVFSYRPTTNGTNLNGAQGVSALALGRNLAGVYVENWLDTGGNGPDSEADRAEVGWTLDSAYDLNAVPDLLAIPHTADTLTIDFIHQMSSDFLDEHVAIDDVRIALRTGNAGPLNKWPGGETYENNFDDVIGPEWRIGTEWAVSNVPVPRTPMLRTGDNPGEVRKSAQPDGFGEESFANGQQVFPLPPVTEAMNLSSLDPGFAGKWLTSGASGAHAGTMTLEFVDLPPHEGVDLDFVVSAFDSIDGDDVIPDSLTGGNFMILVDDEIVYDGKFNAGGAQLSDLRPGITELAFNANLNQHYREQWNGDAFTGPTTADDRSNVNWTLDSAYDYRAFFDSDGENPIVHTADTITVEFVHGFNSSIDDEGVAIDDFRLTLIGATPGGDQRFRITEVVYLPELPSVRITWNSRPGDVYAVDRTVDAVEWEELDDGIPASDSDTTIFEDQSPPTEADTVLYRVRQQ